ncbi:pentatricopeptidecontaining protein [Angomonas deanei]|nr:pentatricopeptidecontaining protein [Angomonas deanei]|eukprot:EPY27175.1 pentatricopeptidecontaining protein [Angomonas deanei]
MWSSGLHFIRSAPLRRTTQRHATIVCGCSTRPHSQQSLPKDNLVFYPNFLHQIEQRNYEGATQLFERTYDPQKVSLLSLCQPYEVRDMLLFLCRAYTSLGRMDKVRELFLIGLRDLQSCTVDSSPQLYAVEKGAQQQPSLSLDALHTLETTDVKENSGPSSIQWERPSLLNVSFFNMYLEVLTLRKNFDKNEVLFVLKCMKEVEMSPDALTYHYLIELHIRAGYNPKLLWKEMLVEKGLTPLPATLMALLLHVVPHVEDAMFVVEVTRACLQCGSTVMDKKQMAEMIERWLYTKQPRTDTPAALYRYPPEYIMWLMLELELRCVLDKASFPQYVQKQHMAELLVQCAKSADTQTAEKVLALMDRHGMTKTADILALMVWCWSAGLHVEKALDMIELMGRKGYLDNIDVSRRYIIESLKLPLERHPLQTFVDVITSTALLDRAHRHLLDRRSRGDPVTVHTLDLLVLACCKTGEDRRALHLVSNYMTEWGVPPRANTYNSLLSGNASGRGTVLLRSIYEAMKQSGVSPNNITFRTLIRQAVLLDNIDEAVYYLEQVTTHPGLRVEVEMILPILERAARAGDAETVNRMSQFSLDCDIGIDSNVMTTLMGLLTEAGQSVEVLKGHQPLHDALRSRSPVGRQRARNQIAL